MDHDPSQIAETTLGPVEYALHDTDSGAPLVLIAHGTPQGHHASFMGDPFAAAGFGTLTPSRPGYLRTPLSGGQSMAQQADLMAVLLDSLGVDAAAVYAVSGGGPSAVHFAARHPDRTRALILESAILGPFRPQVSERVVRLAINPLVMRLATLTMRWMPGLAVRQMLARESTLDADDRRREAREIMADPIRLAAVRRMLLDMPHTKHLRDGYYNDLEQFRQLSDLPFAEVRCPTLIVHGTHDGDVPYEHAKRSASEIANAQLVEVEKGWHLLAAGVDQSYRQAQLEFLRQHLGEPRPSS